MGHLIYLGARASKDDAERTAHLPGGERGSVLLSTMDHLAVVHHSVARLEVVEDDLSRTVRLAVLDEPLAEPQVERGSVGSARPFQVRIRQVPQRATVGCDRIEGDPDGQTARRIQAKVEVVLMWRSLARLAGSFVEQRQPPFGLRPRVHVGQDPRVRKPRISIAEPLLSYVADR